METGEKDSEGWIPTKFSEDELKSEFRFPSEKEGAEGARWLLLICIAITLATHAIAGWVGYRIASWQIQKALHELVSVEEVQEPEEPSSSIGHFSTQFVAPRNGVR